MKCLDIIKQLQAILPTVTDLFTDNLVITSLAFAAGTVTATTASPHGYTTGDSKTIVGATNPVAITSLDRVTTVATIVTTTDHDLTLGRVDIKNGGKAVTLTGFTEAEFNGTFKLTGVSNRRTFTIQVADSGAASGSGSPLLQDGSKLPGFNGRFSITDTGASTFTYTTSETLFATAGGSPVSKSDARISGSVTLDRADDSYTKQANNKLWALCVLGDVIASKSREIGSDLTETMVKSAAWRQRIGQPFTVYVFVPSINDAAGRVARDTIEDIRLPIFKSLLGVKFDSGLTSDEYVVSFVNDGFADYNTAYYVHQFNFELPADIVFDDTVGYDLDVAFRDIELSITADIGTEEDPVTASIDLDEVPL